MHNPTTDPTTDARVADLEERLERLEGVLAALGGYLQGVLGSSVEEAAAQGG